MIVFYHRSSSLSSLEFCEMKYFLVYVLGLSDKTNKKALMGTVVHRVMQVLGDKKINIDSPDKIVANDDIRDLTFEECDDLDLVTDLCFEYYNKKENGILDEKDLKTCKKWVHKAIEYKNGRLDPRNQDVYSTEEYFDIEIKKDWAKYEYEIDGKIHSGYLAIKGTIDLIVQKSKCYFQILDYKTGKRLNWATGKEKSYESLARDPQLLLYYYAMKNKFPDVDFTVSIYYINSGGIYDFAFGQEEYDLAESILRQKFEYIKNIQVPMQISNNQTHWKCTKLCQFSKIWEHTGDTICRSFHEMIKIHGIDAVTSKFADKRKLGKYTDGGGRYDVFHNQKS